MFASKTKSFLFVLGFFFQLAIAMKVFRIGGLQLQQQFRDVRAPVEFAQGIGGNKFVEHSALLRALEDMLDEQSLRPFSDSLVRSASSLRDDFSVTDLDLEAPEVSMTRDVCRAFLAQTFLGNLAMDPVQDLKHGVWHHSCYGLNFDAMFWSDSNMRPVAVQKIKCLIQYFLSTINLDTESAHNVEVFFSRLSVPDVSSLDWNTPFERERISINVAAMERGEADAIVDFANKVYGVGFFYADSMTQEEILQMCCPEINVAMLFHGLIPDNQICIVHNAGRYSRYTGYLSTFEFCGAQDPVYYQGILVIDASTRMQFAPTSVMRDILKAHAAFVNASSRTRRGDEKSPILISTGRWGCGCFAGDIVHKFLQQAVAVSLCTDNRRIIYSSFRDQDELELLELVLDAIQGVRCQDILPVLEQKSLVISCRTEKYRDTLEALRKLERIKR